MSDKDSVLAFIGEVVCSVPPVWSCCQRVSGCLMIGALILKSNMTSVMPGSFLIALSYTVGLFINSAHDFMYYTPWIVAKIEQLENSQIHGSNSMSDPSVLIPELKDGDRKTAGTDPQLRNKWQMHVRRITFKIRQAFLLPLILVS